MRVAELQQLGNRELAGKKKWTGELLEQKD